MKIVNLLDKLHSTTNKKGVTLIEVLLSVGIILIVGSAIVTLTSSNLLTSNNNRNRTRALSYTREAIEGVRAVRDSGNLSFQDSIPRFFVWQDTGNLSTSLVLRGTTPPLIPDANFQIDTTGFYRVIEISLYDPGNFDKVLVKVTTYYRDKNVYRAVEAVSYLTNWT